MNEKLEAVGGAVSIANWALDMRPGLPSIVAWGESAIVGWSSRDGASNYIQFAQLDLSTGAIGKKIGVSKAALQQEPALVLDGLGHAFATWSQMDLLPSSMAAMGAGSNIMLQPVGNL